MLDVRRRHFITLLGGAAAWPLAARAQRPAMKRVGVLMGALEADAEYQARIKAFREALASLGWSEENNIHLDIRWGITDADIRRGATELVELSPDALLTNAPPSALALQKATVTIPIVFAAVTDPVLLGLVEGLAMALPRPKWPLAANGWNFSKRSLRTLNAWVYLRPRVILERKHKSEQFKA
jgi:putative tryptophan/tyrosine transport system substrate-binding protein